jgi:Domain of unknown function (DUF2804), N-terminal/Domain of unknown function (DUF2804), C-terminal
MQRELTTTSPLLDKDGNLVQVGWARQPLLDCNLEKARFYRLARPLQAFRLKRWDYYGVTTPEFFFSATLAHLGYAGTVFCYTVDFTRGELDEETLLVPLGRGIHLPRNSDEGDGVFDNGKVRIAFRLEGANRQVQVDWPAFNNGQGLSADVSLHLRPEHESLAIVIPIPERRFYYNRKINCLPAAGWVQRGKVRTTLTPQDSLGNLDWGRGAWEYRSFWVWASASTFLPDRRTLGLNLGFGFGDTSAATENAIILNGRVHKLGQVRFDYDSSDFMRPWRMTAPSGRLDLEFIPFKERVARSHVLLIQSEVHQMFGHYQGQVVTDDGETILIQGVTGFAEEHHAQW